jgi:1-hydroxycarotenoid 3,4-desaturase
MRQAPVIVVGAGMGGLVAALELSSKGLPVLLLERAGQPGGKMRQVGLGGRAMDAGPTVFTMRWVFDELLESVGERLGDLLSLRPADVLARHAWRPGETLDLFADKARSAEAIGAFAGPAAARGYLEFCERAARIYRTLEEPFLRGSRPNPLSLARRVGMKRLPDLMRISPFSTMWRELGRYFADSRLRQLFGRYATYCGSSPYLAPATLMLVAHVEQEGVWLVEGGMYRVAQCMESLARRNGAALRFNAPVDEILVRDGRASGVRLAGGEEIEASAVVFNGDASALAGGLLGRAARHAARPVGVDQRSLSALTINLLARTEGFPLSHHTVFFSADYAREFDEILVEGRLPSSPTVYVCAQDRTAEGLVTTRGGPERLLLIVNAPATGDVCRFTAEELARCESRAFRQMANCGLKVQRTPDLAQSTSPQDFERLFPATGGALYGRASHGWAASFSRSGARSRLAGLYLTGGSVHPGPGVPMAALSGRQAAASVLEDLSASTRRRSTSTSRTAATRGGISTL